MTSAAFTINGTVTPCAVSVAGGSTVALELVDLTGATVVQWAVESASRDGVTLPTITQTGNVGQHGSFTFPAAPGDGLGLSLLVSCTVTDGAGQQTVMRGVCGIAGPSGLIPVAYGERDDRRATGWTDEVNTAIATAGTGGGGVTDHGALTGLGDDDHAQYVHTSTSRTITARHTFAPATYAAPFSLGANAIGQLVSGLNADKLDGQDGSYYTDLGNATGSLAFSKIDTSDGVDFGNSIKVGTAGGDPAVYADGDLTLFALGGDLILAAQSFLVFRDQTNYWGRLSKEYGLDIFLDNTVDTAEHKLGISDYSLTTSGATGSRFKVDPVSLVLGTIATPEVSLGLTTSKVPLEFRVVDGTGYGTGLTLSPDSIKASGNLLLKDSSGANQLVIATTGSTFQGVPRYKENPLGPGDGSTWSSYFEDFRGVYSGSSYVFAGGLIPVYSGTGSAISTVACTTNEMGILRVGVGTTATGYGGLRNGSASGLCFGVGRNYLKTRVRLPNLSDGTDSYVVRLGWTDGITGNAPTDGAYFRYSNTENGGRWTCVTVSGNNETTADSGVAVAANTWNRPEITISETASSASFVIDGVPVATLTTNIPSGSARGTITGFWIAKTAGTSNRYMDLDYVHEVNEFTTLR